MVLVVEADVVLPLVPPAPPLPPEPAACCISTRSFRIWLLILALPLPVTGLAACALPQPPDCVCALWALDVLDVAFNCANIAIATELFALETELTDIAHSANGCCAEQSIVRAARTL
jgi:hypothetical protein